MTEPLLSRNREAFELSAQSYSATTAITTTTIRQFQTHKINYSREGDEQRYGKEMAHNKQCYANTIVDATGRGIVNVCKKAGTVSSFLTVSSLCTRARFPFGLLWITPRRSNMSSTHLRIPVMSGRHSSCRRLN